MKSIKIYARLYLNHVRILLWDNVISTRLSQIMMASHLIPQGLHIFLAAQQLYFVVIGREILWSIICEDTLNTLGRCIRCFRGHFFRELERASDHSSCPSPKDDALSNGAFNIPNEELYLRSASSFIHRGSLCPALVFLR